MIKPNLRMLYKLIRAYPIVFSVFTLISLFFPYTTYWIYDLIGASLYTIIICFVASYPFKLCAWYRILCISSGMALILEWVDINITKINHCIYVIQITLIVGIITSTIWRRKQSSK